MENFVFIPLANVCATVCGLISDNFVSLRVFMTLTFLHLVLYYFKACKEFFMVVKIACF